MTGFEAVAVSVGAVIIGAVGLWLGLSLIWHRRQRPEPRNETTARMNVAVGYMTLAENTGFGNVATMTDWLPERPEDLFAWPEVPYARRPFDQDNPRPWAHG